MNADALHRWFLTCHERAAITSAVGGMCGSDDPDRIGTHKEAALKRVERAEKLASEEKGKAQINSFIEQWLKTNTVSFWEAIPNLKINTFSSMKKKTTIKPTNLKLVTLMEDRDLFGRLMIVANFLQVNVIAILCYEFSTAPYALAHTDGTLRKTTKSLLLQILEHYVTVEPRLASSPDMPTVQILDAMALAQSPRFAGATTFVEMATKYFELITAHYQQRCHQLDVVLDHYWQLSIKAGERQKRGEESALEVRIHGASTPVPKQFPKYISHAMNKVSRSAFLTEARIEMAKQRLPADKELVIGREASIIDQERRVHQS